MLAIGAALAAVGAAMVARGLADYTFYPTLGDPLAPGALVVAAVVLAALGGAALVLRR